MGTCGYKTVVPKWEKNDADLIAKGITPATVEWPERSKHWLYGHGASLDPQIGEIIAKEKNKKKKFKRSPKSLLKQ